MTDTLWLWLACYLLLVALRNAAGTVMHRDTPTPAPIPASTHTTEHDARMGAAQ